MEVLPRPEVILTHESDLDGFVAGHLLKRLAKKLFDAEVRLEAWNTQAWRQRPMKDNAAWVCDLTFEVRLDRPNWVVFDHHPIDLRPKHGRLIHDTGKSAALLCYEACQANGLASPALTRLVALTDIGDLFHEEHPDFLEAQDYAALLKAYSFWNLSRLLDGKLEDLLDHPLLEVIRTKRRVEDPLALAWCRERIVDITSEVGCVDIPVGNSNLILHQLLRAPGCRHSVLLTLLRKAASGVVVSLRSRNGEALPIALKLQGGGHPNAAGAALPRSVQNLPDAMDYLCKILNPQPPPLASLEDALRGIELNK